MYSGQIVSYYKEYLESEFKKDEIDLISNFLDIIIESSDQLMNLDDVASYLHSYKRNLKRTLLRSYTKDHDYFIINEGEWKETVLLTIDCFKKLCLHSKTELGNLIRNYFILTEELYRDYIMRQIEYKNIDESDMIGSGVTEFKIGDCVYVIAIKHNQRIIYKIGRTNNLNRRYREHSYTIPGFIGVVYYELFTRHRFLEICIQDYLEDKRLDFRDFNENSLVEIYETDLNTIKSLFSFCRELRKTKYNSPSFSLASDDEPTVIYK